MLLEATTLGGIDGTGYLRSVSTRGPLTKYRGRFAFSPDARAEISEFFEKGQPVEFHGPLLNGGAGQRIRIKVLITAFSLLEHEVPIVGTGTPY